MKRLCIFPIFDKDGIVDEALLFYLDSLSEVIDRLIIPVIGYLKQNEVEKLYKYTSEIYFRTTVGFDSGAIKYIFRNYLSCSDLNRYDELILANDTDFGPFISFSHIFHIMEQRTCDFWGINDVHKKLLNHIQSDFRVFKKNTFPFLYDYIMNNIDEFETEKFNVVMHYEYRFYKKLIDAGFLGASLVNGIDPYFSPYNSLVLGYPFVKVRAFSFYNSAPSQYDKVMELIQLKYNSYNVEWIVSRIARKYSISIPILPRVARASNLIDEQYLINFIASSSGGFYIYGAGELAKEIFIYYNEYMKMLKSFIVSNIGNIRELFGCPIISISEVNENSVPILVALNDKNTREVLPLLKNFRNVLFVHKVMDLDGNSLIV